MIGLIEQKVFLTTPALLQPNTYKKPFTFCPSCSFSGAKKVVNYPIPIQGDKVVALCFLYQSGPKEELGLWVYALPIRRCKFMLHFP